MPPHSIHRMAEKAVFGRSYWKLHRVLDQPYLKYGPSHRRFFHDPASAMFLSLIVTGSPYPGLLHLIMDQTVKIPSLPRKFKRK